MVVASVTMCTVVVQLLSCVHLFVTPQTAACQTSLSFTISYSLLRFISIESVMLSHSLLPPSPPALNLSQQQSFPMSRLFASSDQSIGASATASALSNDYSGLISFRIDWFDLLAVQGTLESSSALQLESINSLVISLLYSSTLTSIHDYWKSHNFD